MRRALAAAVTLALAACAGVPLIEPQDGPPAPEDIPPEVRTPERAAEIPDAVPTPEPRSRYGNPASYSVLGQTYYVLDNADGFRERGTASWYGRKFHGRRTSSGEPYDMYAMTAAHKTLPLPSFVRVTNLVNGKSVVVKVNDRGPFHPGRIIDLSYTAALKLGMLGQGQAPVEIEVIDPAAPQAPPPAVVTAAPPHPRFLETGAFADPVSAVSLREQLRALGLGDAEIRVESERELPLHRVLLGPYASETALEAALQRLRANQIAAVPVNP